MMRATLVDAKLDVYTLTPILQGLIACDLGYCKNL